MLSEEDILKLIMRHAPKKGRILEVGCKHGDIAIALASVVIGYVKKTSGKPKEKIHELHVLDRTKNIIYGIDSSKLAIANAKKKSHHLKNIFFNITRAEKLDFQDDFFKLVYSIRTLHETDAKKSLKEMYRVLAPNGMLVIIDWTKEAASSWSEKSFDPKELGRMLSRVGFEHFEVDVRNDFYVLIARK